VCALIFAEAKAIASTSLALVLASTSILSRNLPLTDTAYVTTLSFVFSSSYSGHFSYAIVLL
jgi:hypothetical protein